MKIIKYIFWPFLIRSRLKREIKSVIGEKEYYERVLAWGNIGENNEEYIKKNIIVQNIILSALCNLL